MDYETFNKGCLEEAKRLYKTANADQRDVLEKLFPELMGSEDEKVRNALIDFFSNGAKYGGHTNGVYDKYILAWLEKQGTSYTKRDVDDAYLKGVRDTKNEIEKQYEANYQTRKDIATFIFNYKGDIKDRTKWMDYLGIKVSFVGEQGEHKTADKIEPKFKVGDKIYLKPEYRMPDDDTPIANTVKEIRRIDDKHYRFDGVYIFIEDQDKYELVEQKAEENKGNIGGISPNSEWSVEDTFKVQRICKYLNEAKKYYADITEVRECIDWLKSLKDRVQPKQEWSEEDEEHVDSLLKRLDGLCRNEFERTRFAVSEDRDWLESLKNHNVMNG